MSLLRFLRRTFSKQKPTIFDRILDKSVPSKAVYEDEHVFTSLVRSMHSKTYSLQLLFISS